MATINGISDEIREFVRTRDSIDLLTYKALRMNTAERNYLLPHLDKEALAWVVENCLKNCGPTQRSTYDHNLQHELVPELLKRLKRQPVT